MGNAHNGEDDIAFYAASLGRTRRLAVTGVAAQFPDTDGPLPPGRYLLYVDDFANPGTQKIWVATGGFEKGVAVAVAADVPYFPFSLSGIVALEMHVREGANDQIAAISSGGNGSLYVTHISRHA